MQLSTGNIEEKLLRKRNLFLKLIRQHPGISRRECAERMVISTYSATKLANELLKAEMIIEKEALEPSGKGRPSLPLYINPGYEYFAGVDFEAEYWRFVIIDFAGNMIFSNTEPFFQLDSSDKYISLLGKYLKDSIIQSGEMWGKVSSLCVGAPGFIDKLNGLIVYYEMLPHFKNIPLLEIYQAITPVKIMVNHNTANLGTYDLWKRPDQSDIVLHLLIRSGISAVLVINGQLYFGANNRAGELGLTDINGTTLQDYAGFIAINRQLPDLPNDFYNGSVDIVEEVCRDEKNKEVLYKIIDALACGIVNSSILIDPGEILIYSTLFNEDNRLWKRLLENISQLRTDKEMTQITVKSAGESRYIGAIGAALAAMESHYIAN